MSNPISTSQTIISAKTVDIYIPSLKETLPFKNLTIKQYTTCITMRFNTDNSQEETPELFKFVVFLAQIAVDNCLSDKKDKLLLNDLPAIVLALRAFSENLLKIKTVKDDVRDINLAVHLESKKNKEAITPFKQEISTDLVNVVLTVPTLKEYIKLSEDLIIFTQKNIETGDVFLFDFLKFISTITSKDCSVKIDFRSLSLTEQLELVYSLDFSIILNSKEFIKTNRSVFNHYLYFDKDTVPVSDADTVFEPILLDLTPRLFTGI